MGNLTIEQKRSIKERAKQELAKRHYTDYLEFVHRGQYHHFPHTRLLCKYLQRIADGEQMHIIIEMPPRHGKLCADSTPIYTPNGWSTHGQLKVGDYVYHLSGKPIKILWTSEKASADWVVEFSNGDSVRVHGNHEWTIYDRATKQYRTVETKWFRRETNFNKINPIKTSDNRCKYQLPNIGPLTCDDESLNVDERLNILKDLIQPYGAIDKTGRTRYTTSDKTLHDKIYHIALTLGFRPYTTTVERNRDNKRVYQVCFTPTIPLADEQRAIKQKRIGIVDVRYEPNGEVGHCIQVDSDDGLYLTGNTLIPTHNSMTVTETFPSYYLSKNPDKRVITSAYGDGLARKFGRLNRNKFKEHSEALFDLKLAPDNNATMSWDILGHRGGMISTGIGGSITGQGADCMIIDDPIKNAREAQSKTIRDNIWDEWESTLSTRLHDGASVIVIMTRWHEDDMIGRLLDNSPYDWVRIRLPAIAEAHDDLLGREKGQALCPELGYTEEWAKYKKLEVGSRTWASLYQQRPAPEEGSIFKREWLQFVDYVPTRYDDMLISWDMTFKDSNASDYVVGQVWLKDKANYYCIEQVRGQMDFTQSMQAVINLKNKYPRCRRILIEDKANGPAIINTLKNRISGIIPITPKESKEARAYSVTPLFEAGNVFFYRNIRELSDMVEEIVGFPAASHDKNLSWINSVNCREPLRA